MKLKPNQPAATRTLLEQACQTAGVPADLVLAWAQRGGEIVLILNSGAKVRVRLNPPSAGAAPQGRAQ